MSATPPCSPHTTAVNQENPFTESHGPGHEDRSAIVEQRQGLLNREQRAARIQAEGRIEMLLGRKAIR